MKVAGIAVEPNQQRPIVRLMVVSGSPATPAYETAEQFTSEDVSIPEQVHYVAEAIRSRLKGLNVERVVVRRADFFSINSNQDGPRRRLLVEGAVLAAATAVVPDTVLGTGKELALRYGELKATHEAAAKAFAIGAGERADYTEAAAAALAGLRD